MILYDTGDTGRYGDGLANRLDKALAVDGWSVFLNNKVLPVRFVRSHQEEGEISDLGVDPFGFGWKQT